MKHEKDHSDFVARIIIAVWLIFIISIPIFALIAMFKMVILGQD